MKNSAIILSIIVALIIAVPGYSQDDEIEFKAGVKAGWGFFYGEPFDELVDNTWLVGGDLTMWMPNGWGFGVDVKFATKDQDAADIDMYNMDFELTYLPVNLNAYYKFSGSDSLKPYVGGGLSMVYADMTATDYDNGGMEITSDEWAVGFNVIGGIEYGQFFVEGQYIWAHPDAEEFDFLKANTEDDELCLGGLNVMVGFRF